VSEILLQAYFESIYFSGPDGLVFELATMGPGFDVDEETPGSEFIDPRRDE
jgi:glyoxalase family protein